MSLSNDFKEFCEDELPMTDEEWEKWKNRLKEITKRLNRKYYSLDELEDEELSLLCSVFLDSLDTFDFCVVFVSDELDFLLFSLPQAAKVNATNVAMNILILFFIKNTPVFP